MNKQDVFRYQRQVCRFIFVTNYNQSNLGLYPVMQDSTEQSHLHLELYPYQVSGKQPKLLYEQGSKILKGFDQTQYDFYFSFTQQQQTSLRKLAPFIPTFYGQLQLSNVPTLSIPTEENKLWLNHLAKRYKQRNETNGFIILQNLTCSYTKANVFDIKIGGRNIDGKKHKITKSVFNYYIKLNGCMIADYQGRGILFSKYFLAEITEFEEMCKYIGFFFSKNNKIVVEVVEIMIHKLQELLAVFRTVQGYRFISTSLCFIYDSCSSQSDLRLIDFARLMTEEPTFVDRESILGVQNVLKILQQLLQKRQEYESILIQVGKICSQSQVTLIPEHKKTKEQSIIGVEN